MNITIEGLVFRRGAREVLTIPRLGFVAGRVTVLLGPNGAGKSTLLRVISGLDQPSSGVVRFDGSDLPRRERTHFVAYAFQSAVFIAGTVRENLELALRLQGIEREARSARIDEAAAACGITHLLDRNAHRLSGGEAQRANLARALCLRAPVTLLDEPLSGLDGPARRQLLHDLPGLLRNFAGTAIFVTHDRDEALRVADDIVVLIDGRVRAAGPKREVVRRPPDVATAAFLGYTVVRSEPGAVAIAPGALHAGDGEVRFELMVDEVTDLGTHREVSGLIGDTMVSVPLAGEAPAAGTVFPVAAPADFVVRYATGPTDSKTEGREASSRP